MNKFLLLSFAIGLMAGSALAEDELHTFSNSEGKTLQDRILKYDFKEHIVLLEEKGRVPLDTFSEADQEYILLWNQLNGFLSTMRFKTTLNKSRWASLKHEQNITPYFMDVVQLPGKQTPTHNLVMIEDYEEYNALYLEGEGFEIVLRNQNQFPIENIVVESKLFYEQEYYVIPDNLFNSENNEYTDTVTTNKVRFLSETVPVLIPLEEVVLYSECAPIVDHQIDRTSLVSETESESESDDEEEETTTEIEGFGEWSDHGRRRKGRTTGVWVRIGIKGPEGEMVWRETTNPSTLSDKVSWDPIPEEPEEEE
ncbi:hypothetical protein [Pontiella sulfatireligans]|uniref:Uncharacterized protein n=1 Tax=Pontiella sulfatireligans TaxID=2750658 RepID=A0A6C2UHW2_9BACT|nr:hypothetical protein [Pontiella sulfatireligans]VGO19780.1 hypothetical protein SCARR_01839 [Pontiella sulfatireligans]